MAYWHFDLECIPAESAGPGCGEPAGTDRAVGRDAVLVLTAAERSQLASTMDRILPRVDSWSTGLVVWGNTRGTNIQHLASDDGYDTVKIRIDASAYTSELVGTICSIAAAYGLVFITDAGSVLRPDEGVVLDAIRGTSEAHLHTTSARIN